MAGSPAKRNYALVCGSYLPASETFVYGQMTGCERWTPVVLARDLVPTRALFPFPKVVSLSLPETNGKFYKSFFIKINFQRNQRISTLF